MDENQKDITDIREELIYTITQSLIAIIAIIGGGIVIVTRPDVDSGLVAGLIGTILGFYFRGATSSQYYSQSVRSGGKVSVML